MIMLIQFEIDHQAIRQILGKQPDHNQMQSVGNGYREDAEEEPGENVFSPRHPAVGQIHCECQDHHAQQIAADRSIVGPFKLKQGHGVVLNVDEGQGSDKLIRHDAGAAQNDGHCVNKQNSNSGGNRTADIGLFSEYQSTNYADQ